MASATFKWLMEKPVAGLHLTMEGQTGQFTGKETVSAIKAEIDDFFDGVEISITLFVFHGN